MDDVSSHIESTQHRGRFFCSCAAAVAFALTLSGCSTTHTSTRAPVPVTTGGREDAERFLARSREVTWSFPSSSGRPVPTEAPRNVEQLVADRDQIAIFAQFFIDHGELDAAMDLAANTWRVWVLAHDEATGRVFLARVLDRPSAATRARSLALYGDGVLAFRLEDLKSSQRRNDDAVEIARSVGDREAEGLALLGLSRVALSENRPREAHDLAAEACVALGYLGPRFRQSPLHMLAQATRFVGTLDETATLFEESLLLNRRLGDRNMVRVELHNLGHVELRRGHVDAAERDFEENKRMGDDAGDPYGSAMMLFNEASVAFARRDRTRATALLEQARRGLANARVTLATDDQLEFDELTRKLAPP